MDFPSTSLPSLSQGGLPFRAALALLAVSVGACGGGPPQIPEPRPLVIRSGARLNPEKDRLQEIDGWLRDQLESIDQDPSFLVEVLARDTVAYPWETLEIVEGDTARIEVAARRSPEARTAYLIYAHLHLMDRMGRLGEWLPAVADAGGFPVERAIVSRISDVWLYARSVYDATPFDPLEEVVYSKENGYLDAFILTARGEEFPEARQTWLREDPQALERYRQWFVETFDREPPGLREETSG